MSRFVQRESEPVFTEILTSQGFARPLAEALSSRGIRSKEELEPTWGSMIAPDTLPGALEAARVIADAIEAQKKIVIVADYDCDGATACALAVRALKAFGCENVDYAVPSRLTEGYGLSKGIVEDILPLHPDLLITVDNGIASFEGIAAARRHGMQVIVTDHHLAGESLPEDCVIVNPNVPGNPFPSKNLCGVGVIFYVMLTLRSELRKRGLFNKENQPRLTDLVDLVALGTIADVVSLDENNRILVGYGLRYIRRGYTQPGIKALFEIAGKPLAQASSRDLAFSVAPRINAAGRLNIMNVGIECLLSDNPEYAYAKALELDSFNQERRELETKMQYDANVVLNEKDMSGAYGITLYDESWHQGIVGLVASRIKEAYNKPTIAFAPAEGDELRGSGRSVSGVHLRDTLNEVSLLCPGLILKYGGHSMACGLSIKKGGIDSFRKAFDEVLRKNHPEGITKDVLVDCPLEPKDITYELIRQINSINWGQGFAAPVFFNDFTVLQQTLLKGGHLKLKLELGGRVFYGVYFRHSTPLPKKARLAFRPEFDTRQYKGNGIELVIEDIAENN